MDKLKGLIKGKLKYEKDLKAKVFFKQKQYLIYLVFIYSNLNSWIISQTSSFDLSSNFLFL